MARTDAPLRVHWVRHGEVASHRGDIPLTAQGLQQMEEAGRRFGGKLIDGEIVSLLHAPTRRTRESAVVLHSMIAALYDGMVEPELELLDPLEHLAIRNPDLYVAGVRVEMVSSAETLAEQLPPGSPGPQELAEFPFWRGFWADPDRIGYWVKQHNPPGEDADTVARRLLTFAVSLLDLPRTRPRRYICVTHSPTMRAFLRRYLLGYDPGEPAYGESVDLDFIDGESLTVHYRNDYKRFVL